MIDFYDKFMVKLRNVFCVSFSKYIEINMIMVDKILNCGYAK